MHIRNFEPAVAVGLAAAMFITSAGAEASELSDKLIRMHVVANSDSEEDQSLKLAVRDAAAEVAAKATADADNVADAGKAVKEALSEIKAAAEDVIKNAGAEYEVTVKLSRESFPTRYYDSFTLPAGEYESLRIVIGEGKGHNWWCVLFPPLCMPAAENIREIAKEAGLTDGEIALITEAGGYELRFKAAEIAAKITAWVKNVLHSR